MPEYAVNFARAARKELEDLDTPTVARIIARIEALSADPRPPGCRKLVGSKNSWRIRVGDFRVVYAIDDTARVVDITAVRHRSKAYGGR